MKTLLGNNNFGKSLFFSTLIGYILINNFFGLYPYIFTYSRHINFTLTLSIPIWVAAFIFGLINKPNKVISHLIPLGTSYALTPFMVCVETIRNIIRPLTLAIRLATNMIAGHLLLTLL